MIYIYDEILTKEDEHYEYLGETYTLKGVTRTEKSYYLTYMSKSREPVLVMPTFASQFLEAAKKFDKIKECTSDHSVRLRLERTFRTKPTVESYTMGDTTTYHYEIPYKSIQIYMTLLISPEGKNFFLQPSFTIMKDNIFGNGNDVDVRNNPILYRYCEEG